MANTSQQASREKHWHTNQRPVAIDGVEISVADTRVLDVDQNLVGARLLDWNLLVLDGTAGLLNDLRPLLGGNVAHVDGGLWEVLGWGGVCGKCVCV